MSERLVSTHSLPPRRPWNTCQSEDRAAKAVNLHERPRRESPALQFLHVRSVESFDIEAPCRTSTQHARCRNLQKFLQSVSMYLPNHAQPCKATKFHAEAPAAELEGAHIICGSARTAAHRCTKIKDAISHRLASSSKAAQWLARHPDLSQRHAAIVAVPLLQLAFNLLVATADALSSMDNGHVSHLQVQLATPPLCCSTFRMTNIPSPYTQPAWQGLKQWQGLYKRLLGLKRASVFWPAGLTRLSCRPKPVRVVRLRQRRQGQVKSWKDL